MWIMEITVSSTYNFVMYKYKNKLLYYILIKAPKQEIPKGCTKE